MHLFCALPDLADLRVAHQTFHPIFLNVTVSAEKLDGVGRDPHGNVTCSHFKHGGFNAEILGAVIDHAADMPEQRLA